MRHNKNVLVAVFGWPTGQSEQKSYSCGLTTRTVIVEKWHRKLELADRSFASWLSVFMPLKVKMNHIKFSDRFGWLLRWFPGVEIFRKNLLEKFSWSDVYFSGNFCSQYPWPRWRISYSLRTVSSISGKKSDIFWTVTGVCYFAEKCKLIYYHDYGIITTCWQATVRCFPIAKTSTNGTYESPTKITMSSDATGANYTGLITIWPEWTEQDLLAEKWDVQAVGAGGKSAKDSKIKGASFEDPEGRTRLPHSLLRVLNDWKRPQELFGESLCVVRNVNRITLREPNTHLLHSEFIRHYLSHITLLWYLAQRKKLYVKSQQSPAPVAPVVPAVVPPPAPETTSKTSVGSHKESKHNLAGKDATISKSSQGTEVLLKALCFEDPMTDWAPWSLIYGGPPPAPRVANVKGEPPVTHVVTNLPQYKYGTAPSETEVCQIFRFKGNSARTKRRGRTSTGDISCRRFKLMESRFLNIFCC